MTDPKAFEPARNHLSLGEGFFAPVDAADFPKTILRYANHDWAEKVGLQGLSEQQWIEHFGRFKPFEGSLPQPLALKYHGHQFRHYNPDLGDGRESRGQGGCWTLAPKDRGRHRSAAQGMAA